MKDYSEKQNISNRGSEMVNMNNNQFIYSQMDYGSVQMGDPSMNRIPISNVQIMPIQIIPGQSAPVQMGPTPQIHNPQGVSVRITNNQNIRLINNALLGGCSVNVKCPFCKANVSTEVDYKFNIATCLFKVYNII